jgi:serine/threonine protein kinase
MKQEAGWLDTSSPDADVSHLDAAVMTEKLKQLGPYRIVGQLGAGGMGVVFQAEDTRLLRHVALKVMCPSVAQNEVSRKRFVREARAMASVSHESIVTVYDVAEDKGIPYLAMQLLEGEALDQRIQREKSGPGRAVVPLAEIVRIGREVAEGLAAAHERGLIHRDIKPSNIWLHSQGQPALSATGGRVKLLDFGLALEVDSDSRLTQLGSIPGTPAYMAPEQARGKPVDGRADLFSLGCVLYLLCTGTEPFKRPTVFDTMLAVAHEEPKPIREVNPQIPPTVAEFVHQLLAKHPNDRPATAGAAARTLKTILLQLRRSAIQSVPVSKPATPAGNRSKSRTMPAAPARKTAVPPRRRWGLAVALSAVAAIMVAGALYRQGRTINAVLPSTLVVGMEQAQEQAEDPAEQPESVESILSALAGPVDDRWVSYVANLGPIMQARAVTRKLRELNPGFTGGLPVRGVRSVKPSTTGEVIFSHNGCGVNRLAFFSDEVKDIAPLRALKDLKYLECSGSQPGKGQLADLSPLQASYVTHLDCRNTPVHDLSPLRDVPLEQLWCDADLVKRQSPVLVPLAKGTLRWVNDERVGKVLSISPKK